MKRIIQKPGVRRFFGDDVYNAQHEALSPFEAFLQDIGVCVISGLELSFNEEAGTLTITPGFVALEGIDRGIMGDQENRRIMAMPFAGVKDMPVTDMIYIVPQEETITRLYDDGGVKPAYYSWTAVTTLSAPADGVSSIGLYDLLIGGVSWRDKLQNEQHRFVSDDEKKGWDAKASTSGTYPNMTVGKANILGKYTWIDVMPYIATAENDGNAKPLDKNMVEFVLDAAEGIFTIRGIGTSNGHGGIDLTVFVKVGRMILDGHCSWWNDEQSKGKSTACFYYRKDIGKYCLALKLSPLSTEFAATFSSDFSRREIYKNGITSHRNISEDIFDNISANNISNLTTPSYSNLCAFQQGNYPSMQVGKANSAVMDENGNNIPDTYATKAELNQKTAGIYRFKGTLANVAALLALSGVKQGDTYNIEQAGEINGKKVNAGDNLAATVDNPAAAQWDNLAGIADMSNYATQAQIEKVKTDYLPKDLVNTNGLYKVVRGADHLGSWLNLVRLSDNVNVGQLRVNIDGTLSFYSGINFGAKTNRIWHEGNFDPATKAGTAVATQQANGLMSKEDKIAFDSLSGSSGILVATAVVTGVGSVSGDKCIYTAHAATGVEISVSRSTTGFIVYHNVGAGCVAVVNGMGSACIYSVNNTASTVMITTYNPANVSQKLWEPFTVSIFKYR